MAKPQTLQWLKPGKFIWPGIFPFFAATWNWLLDSWDNLRGDFDVNPKLGAITVDRTNPDRPVIRLRTDNLQLGGGGGLTGDFTRLTRIEWEDYQIHAYGVVEHYLNGLLVKVDDEDIISTIDSVPHSQLT